MEITRELIQKVAKNARLELSETELDKFTKEFREILNAFSKIDEADVTNVPYAIQPIDIKNMMREDEIKPSLPREMALALTQHKKDGYFKGPKAI